MRTLILLLVLLAGAVQAETETEALCREAQAVAENTIKQLPMETSVGTTWVGVSANYTGKLCLITHNYLVDSGKVIDAVVRSQADPGMTREEYADWYANDEGRDALIAEMRAQALMWFEEVLKYPDVIVRIDYGMTPPIKPFLIVVRSGDQ